MSAELVKKLRLKEGARAAVINAPAGYLADFGPLPDGVELATVLADRYDFVQVFVHDRAEADRLTPEAARHLKDDALFWVSYPKLSSKLKTDVTRDTGWDALHALGYQGVALVAVDKTWSAMRFRPEEKSRRGR
jgi:hypothetical protein